MLTIQFPEQTCAVPEGTLVSDLLPETAASVYACVHNGHLHDLQYRLQTDGTLSFVEAGSDLADMIYERTLLLLFLSAVKKVLPASTVQVEHGLSNGLFCRILPEAVLHEQSLHAIERQMRGMVDRAAVIKRKQVSMEAGICFFMEQGMPEKAALWQRRKDTFGSIYSLEGCSDAFYGILLPHTGYLQEFYLRRYHEGVWLSAQLIFHPQEKLFETFQEFERWGRLVHASHVAQLNERILHGDMDDMVLMSEAMLEKKLSILADTIVHRPHPVRFVLIAGPSSAGKTTFSHRLSIHLKLLGLHPHTISMDDFFKNRSETPCLPDGSFDFEGINALDIDLFQTCLQRLLREEAVYLPVYHFKKGERQWRKEPLQLQEKDILIIEGIHGLNPCVSDQLPATAVFKIYMNALTHLNLDEHNYISTSDYRLIRRIVRDHRTRGWQAKETLRMWKHVKESEEVNIYAYQEEADVIFNSSMIYELSILKGLIVPLLETIEPVEQEYLEANRLCHLLAYFVDGTSAAIPRNSILAEFIGNSIFDVN